MHNPNGVYKIKANHRVFESRYNPWIFLIAPPIYFLFTRLTGFNIPKNVAPFDPILPILIIAMTPLLLRRDKFKLDFTRRKYFAEEGFWPKTKKFSGDFSNIETIIIREGLISSGRHSTYAGWFIEVKVPELSNPKTLIKFNEENEAWKVYKDLAKRVGVEITSNSKDHREIIETLDSDGTLDSNKKNKGKVIGPIDLQKPPTERNYSYRSRQPIDLDHPPKGLYIQKAANGIAYWTKKKFDSQALFLIILGLPIVAAGTFGIYYLSLNFSEFSTLEILGSFGIIALLLFSTYSLISMGVNRLNTTFRYSFVGDEFWFTTYLYGNKHRESKIQFDDVQDFGVRKSTGVEDEFENRFGKSKISRSGGVSDAKEFFIRTTSDVVTIGLLSEEQINFLNDAFIEYANKQGSLLGAS